VVRAAGEKHQAAALTPRDGIKMVESLKEDRRRREYSSSIEGWPFSWVL
jgi:hypothetical protein